MQPLYFGYYNAIGGGATNVIKCSNFNFVGSGYVTQYQDTMMPPARRSMVILMQLLAAMATIRLATSDVYARCKHTAGASSLETMTRGTSGRMIYLNKSEWVPVLTNCITSFFSSIFQINSQSDSIWHSQQFLYCPPSL
jgi:hypothetical protein